MNTKQFEINVPVADASVAGSLRTLIGLAISAFRRLAEKISWGLKAKLNGYVRVPAFGRAAMREQILEMMGLSYKRKGNSRLIDIGGSDSSDWSIGLILSGSPSWDSCLLKLLPIDVAGSDDYDFAGPKRWTEANCRTRDWVRLDDDPVPAFGYFREMCLSWVESHYAAERPEILWIAGSLSDDLVSFAGLRRSAPDVRFRKLTCHLQAKYAHATSPGWSGHEHSDFDGLALYLAASFGHSPDWLGEDRTTKNALLVAAVYEALRSSVLGLSSCRIDKRHSQVSEAQLRERALDALLLRYKLAVKPAAIDGLNGCLVRTPFGSSIYVHENLPPEKKEWVAFHELGHFLLRHKPDPDLDVLDAPSRELEKDFKRQEREADGFADLWQHVLGGLVEHLLRSCSKYTAAQKPEGPSDAPPPSYSESVWAASSR